MIPFLLFLPVPFLFYWYTCLPALGLADSVRFINDIKHLTLSTDVNNHNLTTLWGWVVQLLPVGEIAYRANLSCVFAGGLAICVFYMALYVVHRCWITALISSLFLMVSHAMWWHSTFVYEYAINALFVTTALYLYAQLQRTSLIKYLYALFFLSGLGLFQHYLLGSLLIGSMAALIWRIAANKDKPWSSLIKTALFFGAGLIPWLLTFANDVSISHSVSQTMSHALGGGYKSLYFTRPLKSGLIEYLFLVFMQFPSLYLLPVALGLYYFLKSWKLTASSIGIMAIFSVVAYFEIGLSTWIWSLFAQDLPTFIILVFWSSFVIYKIVHQGKVAQSPLLRWILAAAVVLSLGWTIFFYAHLSRWGEDPKSIWHSQFNNNVTYNCYRGNEFIANPDKRNFHDISDFCILAFEKLPSHAEFWNTDSLAFQFNYYQRYYYKRLDVDILNISSFPENIAPYAQKIKKAYLSGKDLFFCSLGGAENNFLSKLTNRQNYHFRKFYLNDQWWIYKLLTVKDENLRDANIWHRWDYLPTDKHIVINLTDENVLDFHEGDVIYQEDMSGFGPFWVNDDQIFFKPSRQGSEIGFLLRFKKTFKANLAITLTTAFDAGIVEILLNNAPLSVEPIDLYSLGIAVKKVEFKNVPFRSEINILSIKVIGQNDRAKSMNLGVDTIAIN